MLKWDYKSYKTLVNWNSVLISFNLIHVIKVQKYHDYNVNDQKTSFKIILCILGIFGVAMRLQMVENIINKQNKYSF
jgi:hypothetical protein